MAEIKQELETLFQDKTIKLCVRLSLSLLMFTIIIILILWSRLPPKLPLFYSHPWGEEQLADKFWFLVLPVCCFLLLTFNFRLASIFLKKESLLAHILAWTSLILTILLSVNFLKIITLVI